LGNGRLNSDNSLGTNFNAKHDHEADDNKDERREDVNDVSESSPKRKDGFKAFETNTLGIGGFT